MGPLIVGAGLALLTRATDPGSYWTQVFPAVLLFAFGLAITVAPLTATAMGAAPAEHSGVASAVNNVVARAAGLLAVAVLPLLAGLTGRRRPRQPRSWPPGSAPRCSSPAPLCAAGGAARRADHPQPGPHAGRRRRATERRPGHCGVSGPPLDPVTGGHRWTARAPDADVRPARPVGKGRPMPRTARPTPPRRSSPRPPLGPLTLRNRIIKAATFEGVMPGGTVSDELIEFHRRVAAGGAAMSTVAYLAVSPEGRTDRHCLLLDEDTVPGLRRLTDAVHAEGAAAAAQIGHAGPVANARSNRAPALSPSGGFTPMGSRLRAVDVAGIERITEDYRRAADAGRRGRLRQHRGARRAQLPPQRVPEPQAQPARRPVRRLGGEPRPLRPHRAAHGARRRRARTWR